MVRQDHTVFNYTPNLGTNGYKTIRNDTNGYSQECRIASPKVMIIHTFSTDFIICTGILNVPSIKSSFGSVAFDLAITRYFSKIVYSNPYEMQTNYILTSTFFSVSL